MYLCQSFRIVKFSMINFWRWVFVFFLSKVACLRTGIFANGIYMEQKYLDGAWRFFLAETRILLSHIGEYFFSFPHMNDDIRPTTQSCHICGGCLEGLQPKTYSGVLLFSRSERLLLILRRGEK